MPIQRIRADSASALLMQAQARLEARLMTQASTLFSQASAAGADGEQCSAGLWMTHMLLGDFAAAHHVSDAIRERGAPDPHRFWLGEALQGKRVIVRCLHGLGDAVQMLCYVPLLSARAAQVVVEVPPRLVALARCLDGVHHVITWGSNAPPQPPPWDVQVEVMELPYLFRTEAGSLPIAARYIKVPSSETAEVRLRMGPPSRPRVGLIWSASEWDPTRCLPHECVRQILAVSGIEFWNLQGGDKHDATRGDPLFRDIHDAATLGDGPLRLTAVIHQLDLVLSVDTLAAHLAGALGKPAWVLLQHAADWRWMHGRSDTPWYPSLRLWRQPSQDDWSALTRQVCYELEQWKASI